jgi:hypothetical protein
MRAACALRSQAAVMKVAGNRRHAGHTGRAPLDGTSPRGRSNLRPNLGAADRHCLAQRATRTPSCLCGPMEQLGGAAYIGSTVSVASAASLVHVVEHPDAAGGVRDGQSHTVVR